MDNNVSNSSASSNVVYFSDGKMLKDIGHAKGRLLGHNRVKRDVGELKGGEVGKLKEWKAMVLGGTTVAAAIVSSVISYITK